MGSRDYRHKESKKPKKDAKKAPIVNIQGPSIETEVIGKHKKKKHAEEESA